MSSKNSNLDDRMKEYEPKDKFMSRLPLVVRLDGRSFSKFTTFLSQPYDSAFGECMQRTAEYLCKRFNATLVHTQSDEITMLFDYTETQRSNMFAGGRVFKFESLLAAAATNKFTQCLVSLLPGYIHYDDLSIDLPEFDARAYQLPSKAEATNVFLWRAQDCVRNSVQMLARSFYSHTKCQNKSVKDLLTMLDEDGINWADYPNHFREGTYYRRRRVEINKCEDENCECEPIIRNRVQAVNYHKFGSYMNREEIVFMDAAPQYQPVAR